MSIGNGNWDNNLFYYGNLTFKNRNEEKILNHFWSIFSFFTPLKTLENLMFFSDFMGLKMKRLARNGLRVTTYVKLPFHQYMKKICRKANLFSYLQFLPIFIPIKKDAYFRD